MSESPILTKLEVGAWLRLDDGNADEGTIAQAVDRLVREHGLRPVPGSRPYRFHQDVVDEWARGQGGDAPTLEQLPPNAPEAAQ